MSPVLAITSDHALRDLLAEAAHRAGTFLDLADDVATAGVERWAQADLILLGVDQLDAAARARRHPHRELIVVGADIHPATMSAAELVCAAYVVMLPIGEDWLTERLRPASVAVADQLRAAGFTLGYTDRNAAAEQGWVRPLDWRQHADAEHRHAYVMLSDIAQGQCRVGQSSTVQRSNMRSLHRVFPEVFTDIVFSNVTALGAFIADLPPQVVQVLCGLATEYLVFDEDDLAALERQEVLDSWDQWVSSDVRSGLGDRAHAIWDDLDDDTKEQLWWEVVTGLDAWPEHDTRTVLWRMARLIPAFAARLITEGRRRARTQRRLAVVR